MDAGPGGLDPKTGSLGLLPYSGPAQQVQPTARNLRARQRRKFAEPPTVAAQREQHGRLDRQVQPRQDVSRTLRREYGPARIDQVSNTPC